MNINSNLTTNVWQNKIQFKGAKNIEDNNAEELERMKEEEEYFKEASKSPLNALEILGMATLFFAAPYLFATNDSSKAADNNTTQNKVINYSQSESLPDSTICYDI